MNTDDDLRMGSPSSAGELIAERNKLREQLAAEREKLKAAQATIKEYDDYIKELDRIAEEREKQ